MVEMSARMPAITAKITSCQDALADRCEDFVAQAVHQSVVAGVNFAINRVK